MFGRNIHLARHIETSKNQYDIHGKSHECQPTQWTLLQLNKLVCYIKEKGIKTIVSAPTAQCRYTSHLLKKNLQIDCIDLDLSPIDLREYAGLSHANLRKMDKEIAKAMEQFRYRILPFNKTKLTSISDPKIMSGEIIQWSRNLSAQALNDAIYVLSNSLLVKLANFSQGILPHDDRYLNIGITNGGVIDLDSWSYKVDLWPSIKHKYLNTESGNIVICEFIPQISMLKNITTIIYPGAFGASRFGPYNLFNRLARALAKKGIKCIVFDPVGSGESTPSYRSLETEIESLYAVLNEYASTDFLAICAHSLSANILDKYITMQNIHKFLISPILDISARRNAWRVEDDSITRHGLLFSSDLWNDEELANFKAVSNSDFYFGTCDKYVNHLSINKSIDKSRIHIIEGAGHNFSEGNTSSYLIDQVVCDIIKIAWKLANGKNEQIQITA